MNLSPCGCGGLPVKINPNIYDKTWLKGFASCVFLLAVFIALLTGGLVTNKSYAVVIGAVGTMVFGILSFVVAHPRSHVSMQAAKGAMSYRQMRDAVASEDFERPFAPLHETKDPYDPLLVSDNWVVTETDNGAPIYIPKARVAKVEIRKTGAGRQDSHPTYDRARNGCYVLTFVCNADQSYTSGRISTYDRDEIWPFLKEHFPNTEWNVTS